MFSYRATGLFIFYTVVFGGWRSIISLTSVSRFEESRIMAKNKVKIEIVRGDRGKCLLVNDYRVCGPKPWAFWGGKIIATFYVERKHLEKALQG